MTLVAMVNIHWRMSWLLGITGPRPLYQGLGHQSSSWRMVATSLDLGLWPGEGERMVLTREATRPGVEAGRAGSWDNV